MTVNRISRWILSLTISCTMPQTSQALTEDYTGTIGKKAVGLTFGADPPGKKAGGNSCGYYFYDDFLKDILLESDKDEHGQALLYELDGKGERAAVFKCTFPETDPHGHFGKSKLKDHEVIVGTWSRLDGSGSLPFYLQMSGGVGAEGEKRYTVAGVNDDIAFEARVRKWRSAVLAGNKQIVASMISYPISVGTKGKTIKLKNAAQLVRNYSDVFTQKRVDIIRSTVPHNMFVRYDGVMLGDTGQIWFNADAKVIAINI
jgi:hypothetical protein